MVIGRGNTLVAMAALLLMLHTATSCIDPHLVVANSAEDLNFELPLIDLSLEVYWDYEHQSPEGGWQKEWYYGWDDTDREIFGELGYTSPKEFCIRRYYTGMEPGGRHTQSEEAMADGYTYRDGYRFGYYDMLFWNNIKTYDGVQSLLIDEADPDDVRAFTNHTNSKVMYGGTKYPYAFYQPELLYSAYEKAVEIRRDLQGFTYDAVNDRYYKRLETKLRPVTYIYLPQLILHNNKGRVYGVEGDAHLSGMARTAGLMTGRAGTEPITLHYYVRFKQGCRKGREEVDIVGGRLQTFGLCGLNANELAEAGAVVADDTVRHYMDVNLIFSNGCDSTLVFDVTDQVRRRYRGGVLTMELDMDTIPMPTRNHRSGFDAEVQEPDSLTFEIEI